MTALLAVAAVLMWLGPRPRPAREGGSGPGPGRPTSRPAVSVPVLASALMAAAAVALLLPGWCGPVIAVGVARGAVAVLRRVPDRSPAAEVPDLPLALDLIAACLSAGAPPAEAVREAAAALDGPTREALVPVARALRWGADPVPALLSALPDAADGELAEAALALQRASRTGAPLAEAVAAAADQARTASMVRAEARMQATAVRVVLPVGLCFLPAFVCVGVVPVVVGLAQAVL